MTAALARRELGATGLAVTTLGFGGAGIGNLYRELADDDALAAVQESFTAGVRYFDTAPFYGFGLSEQRLGEALRRIAIATGDLHQGGPPAGRHRPAGCQRGTRGLLLAAPVRTAVRLQP